jgi:hypothetical protein
LLNNVRPQYKFDLYIQGTSTLVNTSGLITASNQFLFENVNPGKYDITPQLMMVVQIQKQLK